MHIKVHHPDDTDHLREVEPTEEDLRGDTLDHDVSARPPDGGGYLSHRDDTADIQYPGAEVDLGTIAMDRGAGRRHRLGVGGLIRGVDQDRLDDSGTEGRNREIAVKLVPGPEVDLVDPP